MNGRVVLGIVAGVLLPVPLILLLASVLRPDLPESGTEGKRISPVLTPEQRMRLSTYHRECGLSSECESPLGCLTETRARQQYCTDSQCMTDAQCPEGQLCRTVATTGDGPLVKFCVPQGVRQEGERCIKIAEDQESACAPEWVCGGQQGWCARTCGKSEAECPEGFFCADTQPQRVCLPTCEKRGCPAGQVCVRFEEGASACAEAYGSNCQQSPCPGEHECGVEIDPARPGKVWMACVERCGAGLPTCPSGLVCDGWRCRPACTPQEPDSCAEGYHCRQRRPEGPWTCQPGG